MGMKIYVEKGSFGTLESFLYGINLWKLILIARIPNSI
jgi:hypothetical protein